MSGSSGELLMAQANNKSRLQRSDKYLGTWLRTTVSQLSRCEIQHSRRYRRWGHPSWYQSRMALLNQLVLSASMSAIFLSLCMATGTASSWLDDFVTDRLDCGCRHTFSTLHFISKNTALPTFDLGSPPFLPIEKEPSLKTLESCNAPNARLC